MKRRRVTNLQRVKIFGSHAGICCICGAEIKTPKEKWILEHKKPLWLGGADDETNMAPAHYHCAIDKTRAEAAVKAKSDRIRARHIGIKKPRTITRWRRFNREIVNAPRERA